MQNGDVPIPAAPMNDTTASTVLVLFGQVHQEIHRILDDLDDEVLNWVPVPGANSIATIITHLVGSEAEAIRSVAGLPCERDREAEFVGTWITRADVLRRLEESDELLADLEAGIDARRLSAELSLPTCPPDELRTGLTWLVGTYGHSREHLGHIQITLQLHGGHDPTRT